MERKVLHKRFAVGIPSNDRDSVPVFGVQRKQDPTSQLWRRWVYDLEGDPRGEGVGNLPGSTRSRGSARDEISQEFGAVRTSGGEERLSDPGEIGDGPVLASSRDSNITQDGSCEDEIGT